MKWSPGVSICLVTVFLLATSPAEARAQSIGGGLGYDTDAEEVFIAAHALFDIVETGQVTIMGYPSFEIYPFIDNVTVWAINLDGAIPFTLANSPIKPMVGGGLAIVHSSFDVAVPLGFDASDTDVGLNLRGGAMFGGTGIATFSAEAYLRVADNTSFGLRGLVNFRVGRN